jgi:hypothetical protein
MSIKKILLLVTVLIAAAFILSACAGPAGPVGPAGPAGPIGPTGAKGDTGTLPSAADLTCTQCHNNTTLLTGKAAAWSHSLHGSGTAYLAEGTEDGCAGCHSGSGFSADLAAGLTPDKSGGDPNPTPQDCRACHQIHTTFTFDDYALTTTAVVEQYATSTTFDGGEGNLCANCHQARRVIPAAAADGTIAVTIRFGPHHGPQSNMLLGVGGAGAVAGTPSPHYSKVKDTCITCHMGDAKNHTFTPNVVNCLTCHAGATDFNMDGAQTALDTKIDTLKADLTTAGLLDAQGAIVAGNYPAPQANALWNYLLVAIEDKSNGVHNMVYANALIDASLEAFK